MTPIEKYDNAFIEALGVEKGELAGLKYQGTKAWDSIGHMELIGNLEDEFDIQMETNDIVDLSSYEKGKEILKKYGVEL